MWSSRKKMVVAFAGGLLVGSGLVYVLVGRYSMRTFASWYSIEVLDQVNVLRQIRTGKSEALATQIESSLPAYVTALRRDFRGNPSALSALWAIRDHYESSRLEPPPEIAAILSGLPPRSSDRSAPTAEMEDGE